MKSKLYLIALCASMLGGTTVYGSFTCPPIGSTPPAGWVLSQKHTIPFAEATSFKNAWIYDSGKGPAKCHYNSPKGMVSLENYAINASNHHFNNVPRNDKRSGYHCKTSLETCVFIEGQSEMLKAVK